MGADVSEYGFESSRYSTAYRKISVLSGMVVSKTLADLKGRARSFAPVDTGNLRASITAKRTSNFTGEATAGADYAIYQEHGTSRQPGTPFMGPATDLIEPGFIQASEQILEVALGE